MKCDLRLLAVFLFGLISLAHTRPAEAQLNQAYPALTVLVFNYSEASLSVLTRAQQRADRIFGQSGIHLAWTDCPPLDDRRGPSLCRSESAPVEIRVRILPRRPDNQVQDTVFGLAIQPIWANVYYDSALHLSEATRGFVSDVAAILGCVIAHEIGHLLLGENHHSVDGIMQARWQITQIQQVMKGTLVFSPEQSALMRANVELRTRSAEIPIQVSESR